MTTKGIPKIPELAKLPEPPKPDVDDGRGGDKKEKKPSYISRHRKAPLDKPGRWVAFGRNGKRQKGLVIHSSNKDKLVTRDDGFYIEGRPDNPAVLIEVWARNNAGEWQDTGKVTVRLKSSLNGARPPQVWLEEMERRHNAKQQHH